MPQPQLPPDVVKKLQELALQLKGQRPALLVWERLFTDYEQGRFGEQELFARHIVDTWCALRGVSQPRAILELAHGIDLITTAHFESLMTKIGEAPGARRPTDKPVWDRDRLELTLHGQVIREVRGRGVAKNLVPVLDAFEEDGWPDRIDSPLPDASDKQPLRETVRTLNKGLAKIRFFSDGSGRGILWRRV